ncbi:MAG: MBL fold metallo-hydrolase [Planctomycetes bacterium]|nr:MBL fold metallo-hydrolase [Planctomycetota bacterium]
MRIEIELLGTGTSYGVPAIGCPCEVCTSDDPRNKRLRSSVVFRVTPADGRERVFLVDVTPDLRQQALRAHLKHLDAILMTHEHADHTAGMDDLRAFYWQSGRKDIPLYAYPETLAALKARFDYLFDRDLEYRGVARVEEHTFEFKPFEVEGVVIQPIPVLHGQMRVSAFRIGDAAYITDTNGVPPSSMAMLKGVKLLVIDGLRKTPHPTHLSLPESLAICDELGVERAFFTHINHDLDHQSVDRELPEGRNLAYDTLRLVLEHGKVGVLGDRINQLAL